MTVIMELCFGDFYQRFVTIISQKCLFSPNVSIIFNIPQTCPILEPPNVPDTIVIRPNVSTFKRQNVSRLLALIHVLNATSITFTAVL